MAQKDPLHDFTKLGNGIHIYAPTSLAVNPISAASDTPTAAPGLVILCPWMFAARRHISRYSRQYQIMYPGARILLLENNIMNITLRPDRKQMQTLRPAVDAIKEFLRNQLSKDVGGADPVILLHAFSAGGSHSGVQVAQAYRENVRASPSESSLLPPEIPISALVLDSCPTIPKMEISVAVEVTMSAIPSKGVFSRAVALLFAYAVVLSTVLLHELGVAMSGTSKVWYSLNDPTGPFLIKDASRRYHNDAEHAKGAATVVPRTYVYSKNDRLVSYRHILEHGAEARRACVAVSPDSDPECKINLEEFVGSMHVNHVSLDADRYWRVVKKTVERVGGK